MRFEPGQDDLVSASRLQQVTDQASNKAFPSDTARDTAYRQRVSNLNDPDPGRPARTGEACVVTAGSNVGKFLVFNGQDWKPLISAGSQQPVFIQAYQGIAVGGTSGNLIVRIYGDPTSKVIVHFITEPYNPLPLALRSFPNPEHSVSRYATPGTDYTSKAGSLLFDPDDRANDDFGTRSIDPESSPANLPYYQAETSIPAATSLIDTEGSPAGRPANNKRFQVRLFDPQGARLDDRHSIGALLGVSNNNRLNPIGQLQDGYFFAPVNPDIKPGDPVTTLEGTVRFPIFFLQQTGAHAFQGQTNITYRLTDGTAVAGDYGVPTDTQLGSAQQNNIRYRKTLVANDPSTWHISVPIPAQTLEGDEWFGVELLTTGNPGTNTNVPIWPRTWARGIIGGNPANTTLYLDTSAKTEAPEGLLEVPFWILPGAVSDFTLSFWVEARSGTTADYDFPASSADNPFTVEVKQGQVAGVLLIPCYWFDNHRLAGATNRLGSFRLHLEATDNSLVLPDPAPNISLNLDFPASPPVRLPRVAVADGQKDEDERGTLDFEVSCDLMPADNEPVIIDWTTQGITTLPADYGIPSSINFRQGVQTDFDPGWQVTYQKDSTGEIYGTVRFNHTTNTQAPLKAKIKLAVTRDTFLEHDETLRVRLYHPYRAVLDRPVALGIIRNDDLELPSGTPVFRLLEGRVVGNDMAFTALVTHPALSAITFDVSTLPGTATANLDFLPLVAERQVISPGQTSIDVLVPLVDPVGDSADEAFTLVASNLSANARPQRMIAVGIIPASG